MTLDKEFYTIKEIADLLSVSNRTVERWIADGKLVAIRLNPRSLRVQKEDLQRFLSNKTGR